MRFLVNIKYDGSLFYGFQIQKDKRTIEGEITTALSKICNEEIKIIGCSRTDRKVHAIDFYFHFDTAKEFEENRLKKSLNDLTTDDIYIKSVKKISNKIHARYSVKSKEYKYVINTNEYDPISRNYSFQYCKNIEVDLLKKASKYLEGMHDFKSFTSDNEKENTIRTINYICIEKVNECVNIYVNADGFLKYMVRNIIGLLIEINEGKKLVENIDDIINSKDRTKLGLCAPAEGLYLNKVEYVVEL